MKRFGMEFTDPNGQIPKLHSGNQPAERKPVFVCHEPDLDTRFQKGLAYWSYYTLVFATFCAFTPELVQSTALGMIGVIG